MLSLGGGLAGENVVCPSCKAAFEAPAEVVPPAASGPPPLPRTATPPRRPSPPPRPRVGKGIAQGGVKMSLPPAPPLIWGGAGLVFLLLLVVGWTLVASEPSSVKFNLTQRQRKNLFFELVQAVDDSGHTSKACRARWRELQDQCRLDRAAAAAILKEGFDLGWKLPDFEHVGQGRANRREWIAERTRMGGVGGDADPLLQN